MDSHKNCGQYTQFMQQRPTSSDTALQSATACPADSVHRGRCVRRASARLRVWSARGASSAARLLERRRNLIQRELRLRLHPARHGPRHFVHLGKRVPEIHHLRQRGRERLAGIRLCTCRTTINVPPYQRGSVASWATEPAWQQSKQQRESTNLLPEVVPVAYP